MIYRAYKMGHVESGNWKWAVGVKTPGGMTPVAIIQHVRDTNAVDMDPETMAFTIAGLLSS